MLAIILLEKNMTLADLEKKSGVAHATLFDIYSGKTDFKKCSIEVAIKLARALDIDVNELYNKLTYKDLTDVIINRDFDLYRSNILHELKRKRYREFVEKYKKEVKLLFDEKEYEKSLYLLGVIEEISKKYNYDVKEDYSEIKDHKLNKLLIPVSTYFDLKNNFTTSNHILKDAYKPFLKRNIFEEANFYE